MNVVKANVAVNKIITYYETDIDGVRYFVCIRRYDEEHYTADWSSADGSKSGELGYGLGQCSDVEREVEKRIREQHQDSVPA